MHHGTKQIHWFRSLQNDPGGECGTIIRRDLDLTNQHCVKECQRRYEYSLPPAACQNEKKGILPVVFAVHCFGCDLTTFQFWSGIANDFQMIWVNPEGVQKSFNAQNCCGYALEEDVNDLAFFRSIIEDLAGLYPNLISKDLVYGTGWSNGGYMVTYAASVSALVTPKQPLFRAIAPVSGFQIDYDMWRPRDDTPLVPLFLHHSLNDPLVSPTGCCSDPTMPQCCCGISPTSAQCTSAEQHSLAWGTQFNQCNDNAVPSVVTESQGGTAYTCYTLTPDCLGNTTYCLYPNSGHFNQPGLFEQNFPLSREIAHFFATNACENQGGAGRWYRDQRRCICSSQDSSDFYCQDPTSTLDIPMQDPAVMDIEEEAQEESNSLLTGLVLAVIASVIGVYFKRIRRNRGSNAYNFSKVSTSPSVELAERSV